LVSSFLLYTVEETEPQGLIGAGLK
jgi:hypothetical protein